MHPVKFRDPFDPTSQPLYTVVLIPARFDSTRLPGKPLADIAGSPMIEHVYRHAAAANGVDAVAVATDDKRIVAAVAAFGGVARLTKTSHQSGTDRIAELASEIPCEIVINLQADEPTTEPETISNLAQEISKDPAIKMATVRRPITDQSDYANPNVVKVVINCNGDALYFSRSPIPFASNAAHSATVFQHVGLYAYRRSFLLNYANLKPSPLELAESLEQLRALENGVRIKTIETSAESIGVDTPENLEQARQILSLDSKVET